MIDLILKRKFDLLNPSKVKSLLTSKDIQIIFEDKSLYTDFVRWLTEYSYRMLRLSLDASKKRSKSFHLDHKYSISEGHSNNIDPFIIAHPCNLEILKKNKNLKKNSKCSITLESLYENIQNYGEIFF